MRLRHPRRSGAEVRGGALPGQVEAPGPQAATASAPGKGLYTDMNAIRRDEETGQPPLHLRRPVGLGEGHPPRGPQRSTTCKRTVARHRATPCCDTCERLLPGHFPSCSPCICRESDLRHHPGAGGPLSRTCTPERAGARRSCGSTAPCFIMQIGGKLQLRQAPRRPRARTTTTGRSTATSCSGTSVLGRAFEISSMGIRVDAGSPGPPARRWPAATTARELPFHKMLLDGRAAPDHRRRHRPVAACAC